LISSQRVPAGAPRFPRANHWSSLQGARGPEAAKRDAVVGLAEQIAWRTCSMEEGLCYVNGSFVPASEAKISIFDRGFTSGEGVYDVTRSFGHKLFKLDEHIARLYRTLKYSRIDSGMPAKEMTRLSIEVFERNKHLLAPDDDCAVWQVISRGVDRFSKGRPVTATVAIFCVPIAYHSFARDCVEGCVLVTPSIRRTPPQSLEAKAKITNKANHAMAAFEAKQFNPRATPLMLDLAGNISETLSAISSSSTAASSAPRRTAPC